MNKSIVIVIGVILFAAIGYFALSGEKTTTNEMAQNSTVAEQMADQAAREAANSFVEFNEGEDAEVTTPTSIGSYESYSAEKIALAGMGDVVLFFHASWCPSCRALNDDIEDNIDAIPAGLTILKTDYDKENELKKKYGVTTQHTLVQVDKDGNLIKKWSGGSRLENLLSQLQ